ncbi:MAG: hypothetical protein HY421_00275, partial [Candidatus Kerfeldbacteria bacterium]|nr:hypothetical protein [Candidatus Kerfeldbacteria bacterium]
AAPDCGGNPGACSPNLLSSVQNLPASEVAQEIPLTQLQGTAYRVTGKYKVSFTDQFDRYTAADPRWNQRPHAGIMTRCKNSLDTLASCGYETNLFQTDRLSGVGSGTCQGFPAVSCTTNQSCINQAAGTLCEGDWKDFSAVVTKRNYDYSGNPPHSGVPVPNDAGQTLEVVCFADVGAKIACDNITVTPVNEAAAAGFDAVDIWAVGDAAAGGAVVYRNTLDLLGGVPADSWQPQKPPVAAALRSITATDPHHIWAVGDQPVGGRAAILRLNPGNLAGWAWIGTSTNQSDPVGWIDFNCGNQGSCASQPSSFGVSVNTDSTYGQCSNNLAKSCTGPADCGGQPCVTGVMSGSAWLGSQDVTETVDYGPCTSSVSGVCATQFCTLNPTIECKGPNICRKWCQNSHQPCTGNSQCASGELCVPNNTPSDTCALPAACSSDSQCTGSNKSCKFSLGCDTTLGQCYSGTARLCSSSSQCYGTCAQNQGVRCITSKDCKVSCSQNPLACRSSGWLSFDKTVTGTPPASSNFDNSQPFTARYDSATGAISGWARLQLGQCTVSKLACFKDGDCGGSGGTCSYANAPGGNDAEAGWVRLRGDSVTLNGLAVQCAACADSGNLVYNDETCKICNAYLKNDSTPTQQACSDCNGCTLKLCTTSLNPCRDNSQCGANSCQVFGHCDLSNNLGGDICFSDSDCPAFGAGGTKCIFGALCTTCASCSTYGISLDQDDTKQLSGFAYSRDLGWIDFGRVSLGGRVFLQTRFGDVYSGGDIGSSTTARAPSFPTGPTCNATYRLVAARTITNFCTSAGTNFLTPSAQVFPLPQAENRYTTEIGELDIVGLTTPVTALTKNKYGDEVIVSGSGTQALLGCSGDPCATILRGRVYHIQGDLTIDKDLRFDPAAVGQLGHGTIVVDGNLIIQSNITYGTASTLANRRQLPSAAFIVKGDITIASSVAQIVGAYYTEKTIATVSTEPDIQLVASGVMVAGKFNFQRKYSGGFSGQEPAEVIIYDGRLQANTPPGLSALSQGLPNLQEVVP